MPALDPRYVTSLVRSALREDIGRGDVTTLSTVPRSHQSSAEMRAREPLVLAGIAFAQAAFRQRSIGVKLKADAKDGDLVEAGQTLLGISGSSQALLSAERVALNFVQQLSGVATLTRKFVDEVAGTGARILDTRKTTPGLRLVQKYAVTCGGGVNHRIGLWDRVLIKDNHLVAVRDAKPNAIAAAVARARAKHPRLKVEVEADTLEQVAQAVAAGADIILLDNMGNAELRAAVKIVGRSAKTEASGGVNLRTVRGIAETGVDYISVGALTHSARAVDIGLDFNP